jgi:prepilin signal peptidase PulO-like enzyme (type II secretory pathway)
MKAIRHIIRGCGTLPHVGEHPGTVLIVAFIVIGAMAGAKGGWQGALFGAGVMAVVFVPMYLYGAYSRSVESEQYETRATKE